MIKRMIEQQIIQSMKDFPSVTIYGPRQCGKTTTVRNLFPDFSYANLEDMNVRRLAVDDPVGFFARFPEPVIIDEIQRVPELLSTVQVRIDGNGKKGQYIFTGSQQIALKAAVAQSLAGRIKYHELNPFSVFEVGLENISELWIRGGFPDAYLAPTLDDSFDWIAAFVQTFLERDLGMLGFRLSPHNMRRVWTMLAHYHGAVVNYSALSNSLDVSNVTVKHWIDVLEDTYMLRTLRPWSGNTKKRMVKSPKIYLRDSGILHNLLGVEEMEKLLSNPILGASWEGFIIEQIAATAPDRSQFSFYRNSSGNEVDMIVDTPKSGTIAFEIKRSLSPSLSNGTYSALKDISPDKAYVIYSGDDSYRLNEDVTVIPVAGIPSAFEK